MITSLENNRIIKINKLHQKKYRDEVSLFLVEGIDMIAEAYKSGSLVEIYSTEEINYENITTFLITKNIMNKISSLKTPTPYLGVCRINDKNEYTSRILLLDNIQDPGNLGTIIRSAKAFNFETIVLSNNSVDLYNDKVIMATKGMIFNSNIIRGDLGNILDYLSKEEYLIYGTNVVNGKKLNSIIKNPKIAIIMGNEGQGMNSKYQKYCSENIFIETNPNCESLNVAVAASIIMYEVNNE